MERYIPRSDQKPITLKKKIVRYFLLNDLYYLEEFPYGFVNACHVCCRENSWKSRLEKCVLFNVPSIPQEPLSKSCF